MIFTIQALLISLIVLLVIIKDVRSFRFAVKRVKISSKSTFQPFLPNAPPRGTPTTSVSSLSSIASAIFVLHKNPWYIWTVLSSSATVGITSERTKLGSMLSSPLISMAVCLVLCNLNIIPTSSIVYDQVLRFLVPLAIPMLLYDADLKRCVQVTGPLLFTYLLGALGTILGTFVAYFLVPMPGLQSNAKKIAAALCARHIGGAVNFVALAEMLRVDPEVLAAALAADNLIVAVYFSFLFLIAPMGKEEESKKEGGSVMQRESEGGRQGEGVSLHTASLSLTLSFIICTLSQYLSKSLGLEPLVSISMLTVALASSFPQYVSRLSFTGNLFGSLLMQMFFAVTGAMGHIPTVIAVAPQLLVHTSIQIAVHFLFLLTAGRLWRTPLRDITLASNANVGGPTTASAMALNKNWRDLVLPGLLLGIVGLAIATQLGAVVYRLLILLRW